MTLAKRDFIAKYGKAEYGKHLTQNRAWNKAHSKEKAALNAAQYKAHPEKAAASSAASSAEHYRKGGRYYPKTLVNEQTGLRGERNKIRHAHGNRWRKYKRIIASGSQIHHEWIPGTGDYRGLALVEADQHMHGIVDVIKVLEGNITLLREKEVRQGGGA